MTMVKRTNAGGRTKGANERSIVFVHQHIVCKLIFSEKVCLYAQECVKCLLINNYWMRLSMIARIIKAEVCVICRSRRLRRITQTEVLIIIAIMRKPNPIIVLLCIFLSKCSMCSLNKKYHPLFELLHKTAALAHLQAFLLFEVHLLSFLSNIDEKLSVYIFIIKKEGQVFCR